MSESSTIQIPDLEPKPKNTTKPSKNKSWGNWMCIAGIFLIIFYMIFFPFFIIYSLAARLLCGVKTPKKHRNPSSDHPQSFYEKVSSAMDTADDFLNNLKFVRARLTVIIFIWFILNFSIPTLRRKTLLGSYLWKWTLLVTMIFCGYHITSLATSFVGCVLRSFPWYMGRKNCRYFMQGVRVSVNLVVHSMAVLVTWVFYLKTNDGLKTKKPDKDWVIHVGTWTFATVAVGCVLWMMKSVLLLVWEMSAVYKRFEERILSAGFQLYFLGHICGWDKRDLEIFRPRRKLEQVQQDKAGNKLPMAPPSDDTKTKLEEITPAIDNKDSLTNKTTNEREEEKKKAKNNQHIERGKFYEGINMYDIKLMAEYFINLSKVSSREDDGTSDVLVKCKVVDTSNDPKDITILNLKKFDLGEDDAKLLCFDLSREHLLDDSYQISYENFEKSMVRAHKNCVALGHTLSDAVEVVEVLNKVITLIFAALAIVAWLLLTDIATNKILVLIASPFLAATFIIGDTCKKTFEGVIFSFINHPFDVGDLCIIDGLELEVKRMGVLTTTFIFIATKEQTLYPNSTLATKSIINLKGEPDPKDCVELKLDGCCKNNFVTLKDKITEFFKNNNGERFEESITMTIEEIGSCIRLTIRYQNVMSIHEVTHSQCLEKKRKQKSELLFEIAKHMNEIEVNVAANEASCEA